MLECGLEIPLISVVKEVQKKLNQLSLVFEYNKSVEDGRQIILHRSSECKSKKLRSVIYFENVHLYQALEDGDNVVDTCFFLSDPYNKCLKISQVMNKKKILTVFQLLSVFLLKSKKRLHRNASFNKATHYKI